MGVPHAVMSDVARIVPDEEVDKNAPWNPDVVRIVCVSDTHAMHDQVRLPSGDILVHTGDFSMLGRENEVISFNNWLGKIPFRHKIIVAGNHEVTFDAEHRESLKNRFGFADNPTSQEMKALLTNCTYLEDSGCEAEGLKFYGTPHQPVFYDWGFNRKSEERKILFGKIPTGTDVVLCHGPPYKILDKCVDGCLAGCKILREELLTRVKPQLMAFGHIHEDHGTIKIDGTIFANSANCNYQYKCVQRPIVIDIPRKKVVTK